MPKVKATESDLIAEWLRKLLRADIDALLDEHAPNPDSVAHHIERRDPHAALRSLTAQLALVDEHVGEHVCTDSEKGATCSILRSLALRRAAGDGYDLRWQG